jgi:hypothetical protein
MWQDPLVQYDHAFSEIPDGKPGILVTLSRMADIIRDHSQYVSDFALRMLEQLEELDPTLTSAEQAAVIFNWVHGHMIYVDDEMLDLGAGVVYNDVLKHPEVTLTEIQRLGSSTGDCDDQILLLGSLYHDIGWGVILVNIKTLEGTEHVYLKVITPDGTYAADPIVQEDFGWELPLEERAETVELPV